MNKPIKTANFKAVYANDREYEGTMDIHQAVQIIQDIMQGQKTNQGIPIKDFKISMDNQNT
ncbi:MAG: hypothetical protein ACRDBG_06665 [Waterburya sp.]